MVRHAIGLPHENLGGVCCFWKEDFERVNGFPNYWGWGIEDVTLRCRVHDARIPIDETNIVDLNDITKCEMPSHKRNLKKEEQSATQNKELHHQERRSGDIRNGIQTLEYQVISTLEIAPRFTVLNVNFQVQVEKK